MAVENVHGVQLSDQPILNSSPSKALSIDLRLRSHPPKRVIKPPVQLFKLLSTI